MNNFYYFNPTKILFGKGMIARIRPELRDVNRVLVLYGQGSIQRNGVFQQVKDALGDIFCVGFGGIEPNPEYDTCLQAIDVAHGHEIDFILAVGGGSVIDAAKFIALSYYSEEKEPWRIVTKEATAPVKVLPFGCIQTLPASGSEMNNAFVLSRRSRRSKLSFSAITLYPRFSVLDPDTTRTLSHQQTALGMVDMYVHVLEQYVTYPAQAPLQDRQAEAVLATLVEVAEPLLRHPDNYDLRSVVMWCGAQAANGMLSRGVPTDWATHVIGHELTALFDITHAQTLAIVLGGVFRHQLEQKKTKLAQYGRRIWGLSGSEESVARESIDRTEEFFERLGVLTLFSAINLDAQTVVRAVREKCAAKTFQCFGEHGNIDLDAIEAILMSRA
ncbi:MAG: iron-containing alcohol dehydrogenase [Verrucomicrobia bacterium]|nr:iron-containing alcohol dehydrogenase [Verrucomicrobiota bacterium]